MTKNNSSGKVEVKKEYYALGPLYSEVPYVDGKIHGIVKRYHVSGALWWGIPYVNGQKHGISETYYESGPLYSEVPYVDGKIHGVEKHYEADKSNIDCITLYEKGHRVTSVEFSINGDLT